jgi:hypothetical protein
MGLASAVVLSVLGFDRFPAWDVVGADVRADLAWEVALFVVDRRFFGTEEMVTADACPAERGDGALADGGAGDPLGERVRVGVGTGVGVGT